MEPQTRVKLLVRPFEEQMRRRSEGAVLYDLRKR
jgi:hypothetical protein